MPSKTHKDKLINQFDQIESAREDLFTDLDLLSQEQLHFRRSPGKWTILQILDHIMTSEKLSVVYIKRKTSSGKSIERSGLRSRFRIFTLKLALNLPLKYKAPKISDSTGKNPDYKELKTEWLEVRSELKELILTLDESTLMSQIFKHPIVGLLNMKQTLEFFEIHFVHHRKQIEEIIEITSSD